MYVLLRNMYVVRTYPIYDYHTHIQHATTVYGGIVTLFSCYFFYAVDARI